MFCVFALFNLTINPFKKTMNLRQIENGNDNDNFNGNGNSHGHGTVTERFIRS